MRYLLTILFFQLLSSVLYGKDLAFQFPAGQAHSKIVSNIRYHMQRHSVRIIKRQNLSEFVSVSENPGSLQIAIKALGQTSKIQFSFYAENNRYVLDLKKYDLAYLHKKFKNDFVKIINEVMVAVEGTKLN